MRILVLGLNLQAFSRIVSSFWSFIGSDFCWHFSSSFTLYILKFDFKNSSSFSCHSFTNLGRREAGKKKPQHPLINLNKKKCCKNHHFQAFWERYQLYQISAYSRVYTSSPLRWSYNNKIMSSGFPLHWKWLCTCTFPSVQNVWQFVKSCCLAAVRS